VDWERCVWSLSAVVLVLAVAACEQAEKAARPPGETPTANQAAKPQSRVDSALGREPESVWPPQTAREVDPQRRVAARAWRKRFQQEISTPAPLQLIKIAETVTIPVVVKNLSEETWSATGDAAGQNAVHLSYHWLQKEGSPEQPGNDDTQAGSEARQDVPSLPQSKGSLRQGTKRRMRKGAKGKMVVFEGVRTALPRDLPPGETAALSATIQGPPQAGEFILRLTLVREGIGWFERFGGQPLDLPVTVTAREAAVAESSP